LAHFSIAESNLNHHISNVRFLNALSARGTAIQKVFALVRREASNPQEAIQPSIVHAGRNPRTLNACCAKATIQPTTKAVWLLRIYKGIFSQHYGEKW